jgi:hypothetical protein
VCSHALAAGGDVCSGFDNNCNNAWNSELESCKSTTKCDLPSCNDDRDKHDAAKCKAELELCKICTPKEPEKKCHACINCHGRYEYHTLLDGVVCENDDVNVKKASGGTIESCAAGLSLSRSKIPTSDEDDNGKRKLSFRMLEATTGTKPLNMCNDTDAKLMGAPPGWFQAYCCAACNPPTAAPTAAPTAKETDAATVTDPTRSPTPKPTAAPTFAPTPQATTPDLPEYKAEDFVITALPVVIDTTAATKFPTSAPTEPPTVSGYVAVKKQVVKKTVKAEIKFAVTKEEASTPAMKKSLECGFSAAIGLPCSKVSISSIGGEAVELPGRRRRRLSETAIEFVIISDAATTTKLQSNVKTAATSGAVVANVQKAAADNGVLTTSLKQMPRALPEPTVAEAEVTVEVYVQERPPTKAPTEYVDPNVGPFSGATCLGSISSLAVALASAFAALLAYSR